MSARYLVGDVREVLATMEPASVDLAISSPPFLCLRSYLPADHPDKAKEIGSEATPADFLDTLLDVTEAIARVLAPHGSICMELGDTYSGAGGYGDPDSPNPAYGSSRFEERWEGRAAKRFKTKDNGWPLDKSLAFIPALYGASLAYGRNLLRPERTTPPWRIRNLRPWVRNNPPVGALGDKVRPATSYMVVATKARDRYFDLDSVRRPHKADPVRYTGNGYTKGHPEGLPGNEAMPGNLAGAPPLDWVLCNPKGYPGAHYATWPEELLHEPIESMCPRRVCRTCGAPSRRISDVRHENTVVRKSKKSTAVIVGKAPSYDATNPKTTVTTTGWTTCGCPGTDGLRFDGFHDGAGWRSGVVLDPFVGSGTTLVVASSRSRDAVGIDLDARNAELAYGRLGWMLDVVA